MNNYEKDGNVNGTEFTMLFNVAQTNYYDSLLGHTEQYQYGRPVPRIGMNMTESISTKLSPFLKASNNLAVASGQVTKPSGFGRLVAMRRSSDSKQIDRVEHDKIASRANSAAIPPATNPFFAEYADHWKIWPATTPAIDFEYYPSRPDPVLWKFNVVSGREVYTGTGSIDPLWMDYDIMAIVARMAQASGVQVDNNMVVQYSQKLISQGE